LNPRKTPLNQIHRELGGRLVDFAGWELPVQYRSALEEHHAVRTRVGVFDVSHMGQIEITGPNAFDFAQKVTCNDIGKIVDGRAQYSAFLTPKGTFVDDIVVYRYSEERIFICVNAATREKDFSWLQSQNTENAEIQDLSDSFAQIAVQGPRAEDTLQKLTDLDLSEIKPFRFVEGNLAGYQMMISRTGYTGEDGFEFYLRHDRSKPVWEKIFEAGKSYGISPAGLAARNTLRLEMCYSLYGNDIDEDHTPLEARLGWIVKLEKDFIGKNALLKQKEEGIQKLLSGYEMIDPGIARDGYEVFIDNHGVGRITSGGFSPSLKKSVGLVYLPADRSQPGQEIEIGIRGKRRLARVVKTPFYKR
jgi:aminomethyltransferase